VKRHSTVDGLRDSGGGDDVMQEGQTMSAGRAKILEILVAGRVTVEQADQLLEALDAAPPAASHEPVAQTGRQRRWDERADDFFASLTPEQLIELRDHDVSRAFIEQMRAAGLYDLSVADLIDLYDHGITPRFVRDLRGGSPNSPATSSSRCMTTG
jgi:hypothetical protein